MSNSPSLTMIVDFSEQVAKILFPSTTVRVRLQLMSMNNFFSIATSNFILLEV